MRSFEGMRRCIVAIPLLLSSLAAGPALGQVHVETGDAGDMPSTAQHIGAATVISGIAGQGDADIYRVCLAGGKTFSASTHPAHGGENGFDSHLFLFESGWRAFYANDEIDDGELIGGGAQLPAGHPLTPEDAGVYFLAISAFPMHPVDGAGDPMFSNVFPGVQGSLNPNPIAGWSNTLSREIGAYRIAMTGTVPCGADLQLQKTVSSTTVTPGATFDYLFTVTNAGPESASNVTLGDDLPAQVHFVTCSASGDGVCQLLPGGFHVDFASIPAGESRNVTITAELDAATPSGTVVENVAAVDSDTPDPNLANNGASASFMAIGAPHSLRFYLHGNDIPGTAGGYTMNLTSPSPPVPLAVNLLNAPSWYSDPTLSGTFQAGNFQLRLPCTLGLGLSTTFSLQRTDIDGSNAQSIGATQQLLTLCFGQRTINIPVSAQAFSGQRLRLRISSALGVNVNLSLDSDVWLDTPLFTGTP